MSRVIVFLSVLFAVVASSAVAHAGFFPTITSQPSPSTVNSGNQATFQVGYTSGCGPIGFQWQLDGVNIQSSDTAYSGAQSATLTVPSATARQAGSYRVILYCLQARWIQVISKPAVLTVNLTSAPSLPPLIAELKSTVYSGGASTISWSIVGGTPDTVTLTPMKGTPIPVVPYSSSYVVNPTAPTIYTLTASNAAGTVTQNIDVFQGMSGDIPVTSCREINAPGFYHVTVDLPGRAGLPCLDVHDTNDVYILCDPGKTVHGPGGKDDNTATAWALGLKNVEGFAVRGCNFVTDNAATPVYAKLDAANMGSLQSNNFGVATPLQQHLYATASNYVTFASNFIANYADVESSTAMAFTENQMFNWNEAPFGVLTLGGGAGNLAVGNTIDGRRGETSIGVSEDGVLITNDSADIIANNYIYNFADASIEWSGTLRNTLFYNNIIFGSNFGIAGWHHMSMVGTYITNNYIATANVTLSCTSNSGVWIPSAISILFNSVGATDALFKNNVVSYNYVDNGSGACPSGFLDNNLYSYAGWSIANNSFIGNDFGANAAAPICHTPFLSGQLTDGGGNSCGTPTAGACPIACGTP